MKEQTDLNRSYGHSVRNRMRALCLGTTVLGWVLSADAKPIITTIDVPESKDTWASSINDDGFIAGAYSDNNIDEHGFVRAPGGLFETIDVPGSIDTFAVSIDDKGAITGTYYVDDTGRGHGFVRKPSGKITTFDVPESYETVATSINRGSITGWYNGETGGFVRAPDGTITTINVPELNWTKASSINADGSIAGAYGDNAGEHGFVRAPDGTITKFDVPGSGRTEASSISADGSIVGTYRDATNDRGFVRAPDGTIETFKVGSNTYPQSINGKGVIAGFYCGDEDCYFHPSHSFVSGAHGGTFDPPGSQRSEATGINDHGSAVGFYNDNAGRHGYLRTP